MRGRSFIAHRGKAAEEDARLFAALMSIVDGLVMPGMIHRGDAHETALDAAYRLAKRAYRFGEE